MARYIDRSEITVLVFFWKTNQKWCLCELTFTVFQHVFIFMHPILNVQFQNEPHYDAFLSLYGQMYCCDCSSYLGCYCWLINNKLRLAHHFYKTPHPVKHHLKKITHLDFLHYPSYAPLCTYLISSHISLSYTVYI